MSLQEFEACGILSITVALTSNPAQLLAKLSYLLPQRPRRRKSLPLFRYKDSLLQSLLSYTRCSAFNKKITRHTIEQEKTLREKQSLDLRYYTNIGTDREFKITMINTFKSLQEKVDNMRDQLGNFNRCGKKESSGNAINEKQ